MRLFSEAAQSSKSPPAYVTRIQELVDMTNNRSQIVRVKGGSSVVKKGDFQVGDLAVYIGVDSVVNTTDSRFGFLRSKLTKHTEADLSRIRPKKFEGEWTRGVVGSMDWLKEADDILGFASYNEGDDVSALLGVTSYVHSNETNIATVEKVGNLIPIPGKDKIELAVVNGWNCIVEKGQFQVGQLAVYLAIGCVPDLDDPNFAFLQQKGLDRIKTMRLGGVVSQGLLCPLQWLTDRGVTDVHTLQAGDNVAALMGATKYIPPEEAAQYDTRSNKANDPYPSYVPKTDALRLQTDPERLLRDIADKDIVITRKEDGCSATYLFNQDKFSICGRNYVWRKVDKNSQSYFTMAAQLGLETKMRALGRSLAIQGELCGNNINHNRHKITQLKYSVFDVFDIDQQQYLSYDDMCAVCTTLGLTTVPLLYRGPATEAVPSLTVDAFLKMAESLEYGPGLPAEGIVINSDPIGYLGRRTHFKLISNKYLLKYDL